MSKNKFARNGLFIAVFVIAAAASFITFSYIKPDGNKVSPHKISKKGVVEIGEKMFIAQVNDIYLNAKDYMGKTIKLEGMFKCEDPYNFVVRYGFGGCCG
ncbi:MAG: hypothetical protein LBH20_02800, partial [Treponema sp.]|nr:hypothetical protein [Treponema sp.]